MSAPIEFDGLTVWYGDRAAVRDLTLEVPEGSVFALLGRNGAGKTSSIRCLMGLAAPTRGKARILGHDAAALPPRVRARVGYVAEEPWTAPLLRVAEALDFQQSGFPDFDRRLAAEWLDRLGIDLRRRLHDLSRGQRAQVALVLALAPRPAVLVLDDPASGLDAVIRREFLETMIELIGEEGRTVLFSSHVLTDVERVADRVAILDRGVLRVLGPLEAVKDRVRRWVATFPDDPPARLDLPGLVRRRDTGRQVQATVAGEEEAVAAGLRKAGATDVDSHRLPLEELFIDYTTGEGGER